MKNGSWEEFWFDGEPSPLERVIILCMSCKEMCCGFHETAFRPLTRSDVFYMRETNFRFNGICEACWEQQQLEEAENEESE